MDVFVSASLFESYGMALAEAVAAGLPTVTTDVGEAARIVRHQKTGLVAPVGEPEQYLVLLRQLLTR
ncbi:MAG: glycosyltransferase [Chromatiales bacterium]|nr:glycosyltransferase [Chromatiales bacterium]